MLALSTVGHFRIAQNLMIWDNPIRQEQVPLSVSALDELKKLIVADSFRGNLVFSDKKEFPLLVNLGILKDIGPESFTFEDSHLSKWGNIPHLARDYALASGIRNPCYIDSTENHHNYLKEKIQLVGFPEHIWERYKSRNCYHLPPVEFECTERFFDILKRRRSSRFDTVVKQGSVEDLSSILYYSARYVAPDNRTQEQMDYGIYFRNAPSAGGLCSTEIILRIKDCSGLESGYYLYDPLKHTLLFLSELEDHKSWVGALGGYDYIGNAPIHLVLLGDPLICSWKYQSLNCLRALLLDIGHMSQLILSVATAHNYSSRTVALFQENKIAESAGLRWEDFLWGMIIGIGAAT